jgi:hypothetical protein
VTFQTAACIPLFFNPFDQADMSMKMQYQATSDGDLAQELYQRDFNFSQSFYFDILSIKEKKIKINILNH